MGEPFTTSSEAAVHDSGPALGWRAVRRDWSHFVRMRGEDGLWAYIAVLWENPSLWALWTYRYGYWSYGVCSRWWSVPNKMIYKVLFCFAQCLSKVVLDASAQLGDDVWLGPTGNIIVADTAKVGSGCCLHGANTLGKVEGDPRFPTLGRNVRVGQGTHILGPVTVADGAVIGPNSVVVRSLPEGGGIWIGTPVRPFEGPAESLQPATRTGYAVCARRIGL